MTRVAGRIGAQDNAATANSTAAAADSRRRVAQGENVMGDDKGGARMKGGAGALADENVNEASDGIAPDPATAIDGAAFHAEAGTLYVVATPIGNLRDVTLRALDMLRTVDVIAAEDTRVTATLLSRYGIGTRMRALHRHNEMRQVDGVVADLAAGRSVALVTDAGTPAISDPGARLVKAVASAGFRVVPIPGPSALVAALSAAGVDAERFVFIGFLPQQEKARRDVVATFAALPAALVFYEAPHRIAATIGELSRMLDGRRLLTVGRELTKTFETVARMPLHAAPAWLEADANRSRGEFVLVVDQLAANDVAVPSLPADAARWLAVLLEELPPARAARVAAAATGVSRDTLYAHALALREAKPDDGGGSER